MQPINTETIIRLSLFSVVYCSKEGQTDERTDGERAMDLPFVFVCIIYTRTHTPPLPVDCCPLSMPLLLIQCTLRLLIDVMLHLHYHVPSPLLPVLFFFELLHRNVSIVNCQLPILLAFACAVFLLHISNILFVSNPWSRVLMLSMGCSMVYWFMFCVMCIVQSESGENKNEEKRREKKERDTTAWNLLSPPSYCTVLRIQEKTKKRQGQVRFMLTRINDHLSSRLFFLFCFSLNGPTQTA
ncbi:MAG: hypothetical protein JOS17DRAFT_596121 [Linnemannia elongata]|nr:MAG: hypothetical protein JOS17DRAFT_596121 [Linnemannia elongata]